MSDNTTPSVAQFVKALHNEPDWYTLGVFMAVPTTELDRIARNYSKDSIRRCLIEVYKFIKSKSLPLSWQLIAESLKDMDNNALAKQIESDYILPSLEASPVSKQESGAEGFNPMPPANPSTGNEKHCSVLKGYLEYRGGPRAKCQNGDEVLLLPVVASDVYKGFQTAKNGKVICPNCEFGKKDANVELSKMIQGELLGSNDDHATVFAAAAPDKVTKVHELDTALRTLVDWEKFGTYLRNIEHHYIEKIKRDNNGVDQQKRALYDKWLLLCPDASWSDVASALDKAEEKTLAEKVRKDHSL